MQSTSINAYRLCFFDEYKKFSICWTNGVCCTAQADKPVKNLLIASMVCGVVCQDRVELDATHLTMYLLYLPAKGVVVSVNVLFLCHILPYHDIGKLRHLETTSLFYVPLHRSLINCEEHS